MDGCVGAKLRRMPMPNEIVGLLRSKITLKWSDGHETVYRARDLRLACRCAACIEETSGRPLLDPATVADTVRAKRIDLVGQYAIGIEWSDGHTTGIYNFRDLRANCPCEPCIAERAAGRAPQSP
jgi:ATP-binding protein involved in chromosome partitioning